MKDMSILGKSITERAVLAGITKPARKQPKAAYRLIRVSVYRCEECGSVGNDKNRISHLRGCSKANKLPDCPACGVPLTQDEAKLWYCDNNECEGWDG